MNNAHEWHFCENQFYTATISSTKKINLIATDHISRLKSQNGNPFYEELVAFISPCHLRFTDKLSEWKTSSGLHHGYTIILEEKLQELIDEKLPSWSGKVQAVYHKKTPQFNIIFNKGLRVFSVSSYENRINEVKTLSMKLSKFEEFADLKADVDNYYKVLITTRDEQQNYEGLVKTSSTSLTEVHKTLTNAMYRNLAMLMARFYEEPTRIIDFFELEHIQRKNNNKEEEEEIVPLNPDGTVMEM